MPIPFPLVLMLGAVTYWPVTAAIVVACALTIVFARTTWLRVTCYLLAAAVVLVAMGGAGLLMG